MQNGQPAGPEVLIKANLGEATFLRGVTTEGQLVYFEQFGGRDIAITERIEGPAETIQVRILPKVQTPENKRPSFAPDGKRLAYLAGTRQSGTKIRITDLEGKILKEIPLESRFNTNWTPKFSPDGKKMALRVYDAGEAKIMVRSAETGALLNLFSPLEEEGYSSPLGWSRDSRLLYILVKLSAGERSLDTIDVETEQVVESTVLSQNVDRAWLSPSGEYLAMLRFYGQERPTQLLLRSLEDGSEKLLTEGIGPFLVWDFDSRHLFYRKVEDEQARSQSPQLYYFSIDTEEETVLVDDMQDLGLPRVSPDGKYWVFEKQGGQERRIWVLEDFLPESPESPESKDPTASR